MSFPKIPDINPCISVTFEDAINLLLISIALEEISLSNLIDAETKKILFVTDKCRNKDSTPQDAIAVNKSVDKTIQNMIKLQMLLQFKLENVTELIPTTTTTTCTTTATTTTCTKTTTCTTTASTTTCTKTTTCTTTATTTTCPKTTTTQSTSTTTCTTSTCSTTTKGKCHCECGLIGKGCGNVSNEADEFYGQTATLHSFVFSNDIKNRSLRYCVKNEVDRLYMVAIPNSIKIECPSKDCNDILTIYGNGHIFRKSECNEDIVGTVSFVLKAYFSGIGKNGFEIVIASKNKTNLCHDSGFIETKKCDLGLRVE